MIETLMALWNRGASGRLMVVVVTFFCLCISISLLFVTVGSIWGSLLAHGRPGGQEVRVSNPVLITATAPPATATATVEVTPTLPPNPCLASPVDPRGNTPRVGATRTRERSTVPGRTVTSGSLRRTPVPGATSSPTLSPTPPAVTPTVAVTPTATSQPTITPTVIPTPGDTPTVVVSPTDTSTPGATPTPTPTVPGSTPTDTTTPTVIATGTVTPVTTPTVTAPAGSPTVMVSATTSINGRQVHDGRPQEPGNPVGANSGQTGQGSCLADTLVTGGEPALFARLQNFFWIILLSSLLGTTLFCVQMYRLSRNSRRQGF